jgi:hypothetical protein
MFPGKTYFFTNDVADSTRRINSDLYPLSSFPLALLASEATCEKDDCCLYSESLNSSPNSATAAENRKLSEVFVNFKWESITGDLLIYSLPPTGSLYLSFIVMISGESSSAISPLLYWYFKGSTDLLKLSFTPTGIIS